MGGPGKIPTMRTRQQLNKTSQNLLLTVLCGFATILVLKGGTGRLGTPPEDISDNPSTSGFPDHSLPVIRPGNAHIAQSFTANQNHPPGKIPPPLGKHERPLMDHSEENLSFLSKHDRLLRGLASSQIVHDHPPFALDVTGLQRTRFTAETHDLSAQGGTVASTSHHFSTSAEKVGSNPSSDRNLSGSKRFNPSLSPHDANPIHNPDDASPVEASSIKKTSSHSIGGTEQRDERPSILLVTGSQSVACGNPMGDFYLTKALKNKIDYCRLHNLDIFYNLAILDPQMTSFWAKLPMLYTLMQAHPEKEWFWWMDSDAMITDMAFKLPMERYKDYNLVVHGWDHDIYREKPDWVGLNAGIFLIRNCEWSLRLMEAWAPMGPKGRVREEAGRLLTKALAGRPEFEADDQSALIYLLNEQKEKWANKVYLENAYFLHGYWMLFVEKYEEMMEKHHPGLGDERWPFVTHFVGCKPCKRHYSDKQPALQDKCLEHMERAFNFADNQVLQSYGFRHQALNTHTIVPSRRS